MQHDHTINDTSTQIKKETAQRKVRVSAVRPSRFSLSWEEEEAGIEKFFSGS